MSSLDRRIAAVRADAGAAFLDQRCPRWARYVIPHTLDMGDYAFCTLGQIYGDYYEGLDFLDIETQERAVELGFLADAEDPDVAQTEHAILNDAWLPLIEERRAAERLVA